MNKLMCHVVAGYPDADRCLELMRGFDKAGAAAIEVQIPFSDPIADGEIIMRANDAALAGGMTTAGSFELIKKADLDCDVYIMSYIQKVLHFGFEEFCDEASACGAKGLIIPDLPYDSPEYAGLSKRAQSLGLRLVPVLSPGMPEERLDAALKKAPSYVYVTSQRGITGKAYNDTRELRQLARDINTRSSTRIMIGFGITEPQDVEDALRLGDVAVVGSAIIKRFKSSGLREALEYVDRLVKGRRP